MGRALRTRLIGKGGKGGPAAPRAACSVKLGLALGELCEMVGFSLPEIGRKEAQGAQETDGRRAENRGRRAEGGSARWAVRSARGGSAVVA